MDQSTHDVRRASWLSIVNQCRQDLPVFPQSNGWRITVLKKRLIITGFASYAEKPMTKCSYLRPLKHPE